MTLKVLAAILAICVVQKAVSAGPLSVHETSQDDNKTEIAQVYGFGWWGCVPHLGEVYKITQEVQGLFRDYFKLGTEYLALKQNCEKLSDESEKESCLNNVHDTVKKDWVALLNTLFSSSLPKIWDVALKLKECLFN